MERYATRAVLRQRLRILCGHQNSDALSGQLVERHNEYLRGAHERVQEARKWASMDVETEFTFGTEQREYNYPSNCGPQDIKEMGCWSNGVIVDTGSYLPVYKRQIPLLLNQQPTLDGGGSTIPSLLSRPTRWMPRKEGWIVWPVPDQDYLGRVVYRCNGELLLDTDSTVVDALCTLWFACADELAKLKNPVASEKMEAKALTRLTLLSAWEIEGHEIAMDPDATFSQDWLPNYSCPRSLIENPLPG